MCIFVNVFCPYLILGKRDARRNVYNISFYFLECPDRAHVYIRKKKFGAMCSNRGVYEVIAAQEVMTFSRE